MNPNPAANDLADKYIRLLVGEDHARHVRVVHRNVLARAINRAMIAGHGSILQESDALVTKAHDTRMLHLPFSHYDEISQILDTIFESTVP